MTPWRALLVGSVLSTLVAVTPVAAFPVPGCPVGGGVFDFIFKNAALFEPGGKLDIANMNLLVTSADGLAKFGAFNEWHGTVVAHEIRVPKSAVVDTCIADIITGDGSCTNESAPGAFSALAAACKDYDTLFPPIDFDALESGVCGGNIQLLEVVGPGVEVVPPGCYLGVKVLAGATAQLQAGLYFFRNLDVGPGGTVQGVGPTSNVRVKKPPVFAVGSTLKNFDLFTAQLVGETSIGNGAELVNVKIVTPVSGIHVHTSAFGAGVQLAAEKGALEPSTFSAPPPPPLLCECPPGTRFAVDACTPETTCQQARACVPD